METYLEMKKRQSEEFGKLPIFWAFSNDQFKTGMESIGLSVSDTDKICKIPGGGFCKKQDSKLLGDLFLRHSAEFKALIFEDKTGEGFIFNMFDYELANHEYCITWDVTDTLRALGLTIEEIQQNEALLNGLNLAIKEQGRE